MVSGNLVVVAVNHDGSRKIWTIMKVCELFRGLKERGRNLCDRFSGGQQHMPAVGRALTPNQLHILNEATKGLAPLRICGMAK